MTHHVQEGTFVANYMKWMDAQETPVIYDLMCAYWALSVALGREIVIDRPKAPVHLNMYMILVSESGIMRKSTSIRAASNLVRDMFLRTNSTMQMIESQISKGALLDDLNRSSLHHGSAQVVLVASELAAMLGRGSQIAGVPALLTDLYDCPRERTGGGSIHSGTLTLNNVYCSFLAGSTPSWLDKAVRPEIIAGGFTSRCYFVNGRNRKRLVAWPKGEDDDDASSRERLLDQLSGLASDGNDRGRIGITDTAKDTFVAWYNQRPVHRDVFRESFESREDSHVLRLAGLMAANEQQWQVSDDHIRRSIVLVAELKRFGTDLFTAPDMMRYDLKTLRRMRDEILASGAGGITRSALYRNLFLSGRARNEFATLLNTMHELDLVKRVEIRGTSGRPRELIIATDYLRNELLLEDVIRKLGME